MKEHTIAIHGRSKYWRFMIVLSLTVSITFVSFGGLVGKAVHANVESGTWTDITSGLSSSPSRIAVDNSGDLFVTTNRGRIEEMARGTNTWQNIATGGLSANAIAVDTSGDLFITDRQTNRVEELPSGSSTWADLTNGFAFNSPAGIAIDDNGNLYVSNFSGNSVDELQNGSNTWTDITHGFSFHNPVSIAVDSKGNLFVANYTGNGNANTISELPSGTDAWTSITYGANITNPADGIAVDGHDNVFVTSFYGNINDTVVQELSAGTQTWKPIPSNGYNTGHFGGPVGIAVDGHDDLFVVNSSSGTTNRVVEYVPFTPAPNLNTNPIVSPGTLSGTTNIIASPNHDGNTLHYVVSNTSLTAPSLSDMASAQVTSAPTGGRNLPTEVNDFIGIYEVNSNNQVVAFTQEGPLTSVQVPNYSLSLNASSNDVAAGRTITVTGQLYSGTGNTQVPLANSSVDVDNLGQGSWSTNGQSTVSTVYSVYTNDQGTFTLNWNTPSTSGVYPLQATSHGQSQTQFVNVQKVLTSQVTSQQVGAAGYTITKQVPGIGQTSTNSTAIVSIPANAFTSSTPVFVNTSQSGNSVEISGQRTLAAVGVNFPGTSSKPITITIQNSDIRTGDSVYKILPDGTYQRMVSGVSIVPGTATITFTNDPDFVVEQPVGAGGPIPPRIIQDQLTEQGQVEQPYSTVVHELGGSNPMEWTIASGSLPPGLSINNQGVISGTPSQAGTYTFTVKVTDTNQLSSKSRSLSLTVNSSQTSSASTGTGATGTSSGSLVIHEQSVLPPGIPDALYQQHMMATGGVAPYTWSVVQGALPQGWQLDPQTGAIHGTTSVKTPSLVTVQVKDANGAVTQKLFVVDALPKNEREIVWEGNPLQAENVPSVVGKDAGTQTTYMPIWYVMQLLRTMGIQSVWDGTHWHLTAPTTPDLSNIMAGKGRTSIYLNDTLVQQVDTVAQNDPSTNEPTTYMPIWYVMQLLKRVGLRSSWNGTTWTVTK